jgi:hypothetical protein
MQVRKQRNPGQDATQYLLRQSGEGLICVLFSRPSGGAVAHSSSLCERCGIPNWD